MRRRDVNDWPSEAIGRSAKEMRDEFDASFQRPRVPAAVDKQALLLIRVRNAPFAFRLSELGGVHSCPAVTRVPSVSRAQLGLAAVQGRLLVAYSLSVLVGQDSNGRTDAWIASWAKDRSVGLVFDEIDGYVQVYEEQIRRQGDISDRSCGTEAVMVHEVVRPVLQVPALIDAIQSSLAGTHS